MRRVRWLLLASLPALRPAWQLAAHAAGLQLRTQRLTDMETRATEYRDELRQATDIARHRVAAEQDELRRAVGAARARRARVSAFASMIGWRSGAPCSGERICVDDRVALGRAVLGRRTYLNVNAGTLLWLAVLGRRTYLRTFTW